MSSASLLLQPLWSCQPLAIQRCLAHQGGSSTLVQLSDWLENAYQLLIVLVSHYKLLEERVPRSCNFSHVIDIC